MPWTNGSYGDLPHESWWRELLWRGRWLRRNLTRRATLRWQGYKLHLDDCYGVGQERGYWVLRPLDGRRSLRWVTAPISKTRITPDDDWATAEAWGWKQLTEHFG
ncbi:hypothetical protein [Nocardia sp. NPDC127526]|uniref:hypothetical protein n=1 Tax=Nocardia sp. NPDC127526 TaxID=3345393 RepID=UPI00363609E4